MCARRLLLLLWLVALPIPATADELICNPATDVDTADWTASSGTDEFAMVNETIAATNGDTTYVQNNTAFNVYAIFFKSSCDVPAGATVTSVRVRIIVKDSGVASPQCSVRLRVNGTNYEITGATATTTTYQTFTDTWTTNPNTAAAWVLADANGTGSAPVQGFGARCDTLARMTTADITYTYTPAAGGTTPLILFSTLLGVGL